MKIKWQREIGRVTIEDKLETGFAYGQISFKRLAEFMVEKGETCKGDDIAAFYFDFEKKMIIYRLK